MLEVAFSEHQYVWNMNCAVYIPEGLFQFLHIKLAITWLLRIDSFMTVLPWYTYRV